MLREIARRILAALAALDRWLGDEFTRSPPRQDDPATRPPGCVGMNGRWW